MKNNLASIIILICFSMNAQKLEKSLLWKVSGKGLEKPSYIFGTIHATCDASLEYSVKQAMQNTSQLYLELDMDDPNMQSEMMSRINMKEETKISDLISTADFKIVNDFIQENTGISLLVLNKVKPFFITAMLLPKLLDCPMQSVEQELTKISSEQNEETYGLETVQEQMDLFDAIPYQEQVEELVKTAKDTMQKDKAEFKHLLEIYKTKDIDALLDANENSENSITSKFDNELLLKRNLKWIPRIEKIIADKPTFIGVGAAHLAGEDGILLLLRKKGYKVEAVK